MKRNYRVSLVDGTEITFNAECMKHTDDEIIMLDFDEDSCCFVQVAWFGKKFVRSVYVG